MGAIVSQIRSLTIVDSTIHSGASKKTSKLHVTGLAGNSSVTGEFPAPMASNAEMSLFDDVIMQVSGRETGEMSSLDSPIRIFSLRTF